jgi:hypothetical protein
MPFRSLLMMVSEPPDNPESTTASVQLHKTLSKSGKPVVKKYALSD